MNVALLSNVNVLTIAEKANKFANTYTPPGYNTWMTELLDNNSGINQKDIDVIVFLLDGTSLVNEAMNPRELVEKFEVIESFAKTHPNIGIVVNTIDVIDYLPKPISEFPSARDLQLQWNKNLKKSNTKNLNWFDLVELISIYGRKKMYSNKGWYLGNIRFSNFGDDIILNEIRKVLKGFVGIRKKCIVLDLDNTLWGGVIGEDGIDGISLSNIKEGSQYYLFQKQLKRLKELGVLLAICSKNNPDDAIEVMKKHPSMVLKEEDFVSMKINWKTKVENISELAQELNIGLDSILFLDDSKFERESVKNQLPEVIVPEFPEDTTKLPNWFTNIQKEYFMFILVTEEDTRKTEMYRSQMKREYLKKTTPKLDEYLKSLQMKQRIWFVTEKDIPRAAQLTQKTNQFNLTTRRYTEFDIRRMVESDDYIVLMSSMRDKFGDNGKIALMIIEKADKVKIDTFLMSCRVMGRYIENQFVDYVENMLSEMGIEEIEAEYIPTKKSVPVKDFWDSLGYKRAKEENGLVKYKLKIREKPRRIFYSELDV